MKKLIQRLVYKIWEESFKLKYMNLFAGLPLEAEGGSFSLRLSIAIAIVGSMLHIQCQCPADPKVFPRHS